MVYGVDRLSVDQSPAPKARMTRPTRGVRILGITILFTLPIAELVEGWRYATPAMIVTMITAAFLGEAWHRWCQAHESPER